jgi:copper(I)-binding protein
MKRFHELVRSAACAVWLLSVTTLAASESDLVFDAAWIRPLPPGMKMTAGFGQLRNTGTEEIRLTAFASPEFGDVSLHRTEVVDGMSRMREVTSLTISPGETVELAPGGYHLMLMMPTAPLVAGQFVTVDMRADGGRAYRFELPVERR